MSSQFLMLWLKAYKPPNKLALIMAYVWKFKIPYNRNVTWSDLAITIPQTPSNLCFHALFVLLRSDIMWPWCWVGKRKLEAAMMQTAHLYDFTVTWEPFLLRPGIPLEGVEKPDMYKSIRWNVQKFIEHDDVRVTAIPNRYWFAFGIPFHPSLLHVNAETHIVSGSWYELGLRFPLVSGHYSVGSSTSNVLLKLYKS